MRHLRRRFGLLLLPVFALGLTACFVPSTPPVLTDFFSDGGGSGQWTTYTPAPPGSSNNRSIALVVPDSDAYAGVELITADSTAPTTPPSFSFLSTVSNASSGGSPRLVIRLSDGCQLELRPLSWTANTWTTVDGAASDTWDSAGGGECPFIPGTSYATALAAHPGATVTSVYVVTDSGWLTAPYTHYIDNISYDGLLITTD